MINYAEYIKDVKDFPTPGVVFRDFSPLLATPEVFKQLIKDFAEASNECDVVLAPDARGFILGVPLAFELNKPFIMARKPHKLPGEVVSEEYSLEYGHDKLEIQKNAIKKGDRVLIVDDILATGGTILALKKLVEKMGGTVVNIMFLAELVFLQARQNLFAQDESVISFVKYE